jgi:WD40 repeat protein
VAFSPDGNILSTGSSDATVLLWDLTGLNQLRSLASERACSIAGRGLNDDEDEWDRYIPGLAYRNTCPA